MSLPEPCQPTTLHMIENHKSTPAISLGRLSIPLIACSVLISLVVLVAFLQGIWRPGGRLIGVYIPDSVTYLHQLEFASHDLNILSLLKRSSTSGMLGYLPFVLIHPTTIVVANTAMLAVSIWAAARIFRASGRVSTMLACFAIALNPYMLIGVTGPNKEIPLSMLTLLLLAIQPTRRTAPFLIFLVGVTVYIRQGYGLLLAAWILGRLILRESKWAIYRKILLLSPPLIAASFVWLKEVVPVIRENFEQTELLSITVGSRTLAASLASIQNPLSAIAFFVFRLFANASYLAVRPSVFGPNGEVAMLGLAYWIYGLLLALGAAGLLSLFFWRRRLGEHHYDLVRLLLFIWLGVSVGLFIQPRYLMPVLSPSLGLLGILPVRHRLVAIIGVSVLVPLTIFVLALYGRYPGVYEEPPVKPEFFLNL